MTPAAATKTGTVLGVTETAASRSLSVKVGDQGGFSWERSFAVRVDSPATPLITILSAPGVNLWAPHPEDMMSRAQSFSVKPRGDSSMTYDVTISYSAVDIKNEDRQEQKPGDPPGTTDLSLPAPVWSGGTALEEVPFDVDADGNMVANSAKVPFPESSSLSPRRSLTCTRSYKTYADYNAAAKAFVGKINDGTWGGEAAETWLCASSRWSWKAENVGGQALRYIEASFEFQFDPKKHRMMYLDIGYQKRGTDGKLEPILGKDGKPVKEPVALNGAGQPMDPPPAPGTPPKICNGGDGFKQYATTNFVGIGNPK
jgi:hypothetical protein